MVRNEMPLLKWTIPYYKTMCDDLLIVDDGSTDGTKEYLQKEGVKVVDNEFSAFAQDQNVRKWLRNTGYDWVLAFDADEFLFDLIGLDDNYESIAYQRVNFIVPDTFDWNLNDLHRSIEHKDLGNENYLYDYPRCKVIARGDQAHRLDQGYHEVIGGSKKYEPEMVCAHLLITTKQRLIEKRERMREIETGPIHLSPHSQELRLEQDIDLHWKEHTYPYLKDFKNDYRLIERLQVHNNT